MASPSKKRPFDDDDQGPSFTLPSPPKRQKVGDDGYDDGDNNGDDDSDDTSDVFNESEPELVPESRDDEPFPLDLDDGDTSFESVESIGYHTVDDSDDDVGSSNDDGTDMFSDEEDW
jgi:hypothetical protein